MTTACPSPPACADLEAILLSSLLSSAPLPALSQSAIRLLELSRDLENGPNEYTESIETDEALTLQVLRFVNSSYFDFSQKISSVKQGITLVGTPTVRNFVLGTAVFSTVPDPKCGPFDLKVLRQDSLLRGIFARTFARLLGSSNLEETFTVALLQDIAIPLIAKEMPEIYFRFLEQREGGRVRLSDLEQQEFGWTHADAAAHLFRIWNFPSPFAGLVKSHCSAERLLTEPQSSPEQLAVALSSHLPGGGDDWWHEMEYFETCFSRLVPSETTSCLVTLLEQTDHECQDLDSTLGIGVWGPSLVARYREMSEEFVS